MKIIINEPNSLSMKRPLGKSDAPKIAVAIIVVLLLVGATWTIKGRANTQGERARMITQMKLEAGVLNAKDQFLSPAEADEAQNEREEKNTNFRP